VGAAEMTEQMPPEREEWLTSSTSRLSGTCCRRGFGPTFRADAVIAKYDLPDQGDKPGLTFIGDECPWCD
jgi:hypothetical protein